MTKYREILRMANENFSQHKIAGALRISRNTVRKTLHLAKEKGLNWQEVLRKELEEDQVRLLLFPKTDSSNLYFPVDCPSLEKELGKVGVSLQMLWLEYCDKASAMGKKPYMYSRFCDIYRVHTQINQATMRVPRTPGKDVEVDWAGKTGYLKDPATGELVSVYIFVASMSYSQYSYAEGFLSMDLDAWLTAHIHLFEFLKGVPKNVVPDNLKTGIKKACYYEPDIQRNYQELAEHYSTFVIPARVRHPKDKPNAESAVNNLANNLLGKIRNQTFFTLEEFNETVREHIELFNTHSFQKKTGSRSTLFREEIDLLTPLPRSRYEMAIWKIATVQPNYHISVNGMYYSVPFQYIRQKLDIKLSSSLVQIFQRDKRIASHPRLFGRLGQYHTITEHMPEKHQKALEWSADRFLTWAEKYGDATKELIRLVLSAHVIEQQAYRSCLGILKLAQNGKEQELERACLKVLSLTDNPSWKLVKTVFNSQSHGQSRSIKKHPSEEHAFIRNLREDTVK